MNLIEGKETDAKLKDFLNFYETLFTTGIINSPQLH